MNIDYESIYKFIEEFQRKKPEWDTFRSKIPEALRDKWLKVLNICRENGFIGPYAHDGKILFHQILTHNRKHVDKCTMCDNDFIDYSCRGKMTNGGFRPCWT